MQAGSDHGGRELDGKLCIVHLTKFCCVNPFPVVIIVTPRQLHPKVVTSENVSELTTLGLSRPFVQY